MTDRVQAISLSLIRKAQEGYAESTAQLSKQMREMLVVYLYRITLDHHLSQDLCQESLLEMVRYLPRLKIEHPNALRAWLYKTATHKVYKHLKEKCHQRLEDCHEDEIEIAYNDDLRQLERQELAQTVSKAMRRLKPRHRTILTLRCYEELSYKEIVTIVGGTELQAKLLFFRAKGYLRRQLHRDGFNRGDLIPALGLFAALTAGTSKKAVAAINPATVEVAASTTVVGSLLSVTTVSLVALLGLGTAQWVTRGGHGTGPGYYTVQPTTRMDTDLLNQIESRLEQLADNYQRLNVGVVQDADIVLLKSYGASPDLSHIEGLFSASEPVTGFLLLKMWQEGVFASLDTPVHDLYPHFCGGMPPRYAETPVTLRHLLTHSSGLPMHNNEGLCKDGYFNLAFQPGSQMAYSSTGYGVLGEIVRHITGMGFPEIIQQQVAQPLGLSTLTVRLEDRGPSIGLAMNIEDFATFAIAVMAGEGMSSALLVEQTLRKSPANYGLGWHVSDRDSPTRFFHHGGDGGLSGAIVRLHPLTRSAIVLQGHRTEGRAVPELDDLAVDLLALVAPWDMQTSNNQ